MHVTLIIVEALKMVFKKRFGCYFGAWITWIQIVFCFLLVPFCLFRQLLFAFKFINRFCFKIALSERQENRTEFGLHQVHWCAPPVPFSYWWRPNYTKAISIITKHTKLALKYTHFKQELIRMTVITITENRSERGRNDKKKTQRNL